LKHLSADEEKELIEYLTYSTEQEGEYEQGPLKKDGAAAVASVMEATNFECYFVAFGVGKSSERVHSFPTITKFA
jgi:hypothetical protein